ncbi:N-acetyl-gamma-glutamyl-phosphate reductase [Desulfospira joergensenii]|uniref:N-acetyl-gamma-glutamyl-phosphate reductase n=1 Tax=Desulfospira joergensenii TaxID=53329 RepID=UPI0003B3A220|nr:N-acetyl-gamma-glutamyl-phosphate reductase [Desulfospira joergensenii]
MYKIFIDGQEGTTGLQIKERLEAREDIELIEIPGDKRKDIEVKREIINHSDLVILCLPDAAARESVSLAENETPRFIDASTAHRTHEDWVYGLPEMEPDHRRKIAEARFVANPGCYPTGFILAVRPLIRLGIMPKDYPATVHALSGYSGGGKKLIAAHGSRPLEEVDRIASRPYGFSLKHKHIPEMQKYAGLTHAPVFSPQVGHFYNGMLVNIPLFPHLLNRKSTPDQIRDALIRYYENEPFVRVMEGPDEDHLEGPFLSPLGCNATNRVEIFVFGHEDQILLTSRLDNLGKGASGAAVQNLNIMMGAGEDTGLIA